MTIPKDLEEVFEDARRHLASLKPWQISSETRKEIKRLKANIKMSVLSKPDGDMRSSKNLKVNNTIETTCFGKCSEIKRTRTTHLMFIAEAIYLVCTKCGDQNTSDEREVKWKKYL